MFNSGQFGRDGSQWELLFGSLLWILWLQRNERIFEPEKVRWETVLSYGKRLVQKCQDIATLFRLPRVGPVLSRDEVCWKKPPVGWCKLNTDGVVKGHSRMALCGGVVRSDLGFWIIDFSRCIGVCSILDVELWGIYK
ncbi:hypothetical protein V6N11_075345 [Hibiscus sabdariffa]|uniref:Uncharacterized protein n=1 Tax=Hibiscus sabdariffa TaxID=183260 RepID=A0ABR2R6R5_9ROSI